ncbi:MAG TPA: HAMP domain-containing sensor histidine kinase [Pirellulales bacterium]|jgi:signal transduction histidine kinase|nr:HAMP domain-containing sensor histidine kinase [Pirellulales bacterium]
MSLVNRLSAFFLAALALILAVFSLALCALAAHHLERQLDQRLSGTLDALEAALHVEPDGMEWKPQERRLTLGLDNSVESARWAIAAPRGPLIDQSANSRGGNFPVSWLPAAWPAGPPEATVYESVPGWRLAARRLRLAEMLARGRKDSEDDEANDEGEYSELTLTAGLSPEPMRASLHQLELVLAGLSLVAWLACAVAGRQFCRQALAPVSRLAIAARQIPANDAAGRLPSPGSHDELEQLTIAFNGLLDRLHASSDRQRRFASDASHQLRTPISGLLSLVEVIRRRQRPAGEYEEALDRIHHEATRMRQMIESLLFLARNESDAAAVQTEPVDLNVWIPEQLQRWSHHARAADFRSAVASDRPAWVDAQPVLLSQIFDNLLDNACKYSEPGSPITISVWTESTETGFAVADQGPGIAPEDLPRIFEPFFRASSALGGGRTGSGLGLPIARKMAASLGGRIDVQTAQGQGTRFVVGFKAAKPGRGRAPQLAPPEPTMATRSPPRPSE